MIARLGGGRSDVLPVKPRGLPGRARFLQQLRGARVISAVDDLAQALRVDRDRDPSAGGMQPLGQPAQARREIPRERGGALALPARCHVESERDPCFEIGRARGVAVDDLSERLDREPGSVGVLALGDRVTQPRTGIRRGLDTHLAGQQSGLFR